MTSRLLPRRRRQRLALAVVLVTGLAFGGLTALNGLAPDTAASGPHRDPSPISLTADAGGVVDIVAQLGYPANAVAAGTGIVVGPSGEVLTNNHVIEGATQIQVTVPGGSAYPAQVLGSDPQHDVALLEVGGAPALVRATLGDSSQVKVGDPVTAIGNAGGVGGTPSMASGKVTGLDQSITTTDETGFGSEHLSGLIQTDARVEPGDSGGPLVNAAGQVIGMDTATAVDQPGQHRAPEGFAIPINRALAIVRSIEAGSAAPVPVLAPMPVLGIELLVHRP
jgi:S1-C subfamily serine protease